MPARPVARLEPNTVGATGRVWTMLEPRNFPEAWDPKGSFRFSAGSDDGYLLAKNACQFIREVSPRLYKEWHQSVQGLIEERRRVLVRGTSPTDRFGDDALSEIDPEGEARRSFSSAPQPPACAEPVSFDVPTIGRGHWLWHRHYGNAHFTSAKSQYTAEQEGDSDAETVTDYLKAYQRLATKCRGRDLFKSTVNPDTLSDVYGSCFELCVFELRLPPQFFALIHYGLGVTFALTDVFKQWNGKGHYAEKYPEAFSTTKEVFEMLTDCWREDFPAGFRSKRGSA